MVKIEGNWFWDRAWSPTPRCNASWKMRRDSRDALVFQVELFPARGPLPRDMEEVWRRRTSDSPPAPG